VFRPLDTVPVAVVVAAYLAVTKRASLRVFAWLAGGVALGWAPWLIEMTVRFGNPVSALRHAGSAGHVGTAYLGLRFSQNLALTNGPTIGPVLHPDSPVIGVLWWSGVVVLVGIGLLEARKTPLIGALVLATAVGLSLALLYFVFVVGFAPRFLLPSYALLAIPAAVGMSGLWSGRTTRRIAFGVAAAALLVWLGFEAATADRIEAETAKVRAVQEAVGAAVRALADGKPCTIVSGQRVPQVQLVSGCIRRQYRTSTVPSMYRPKSTAIFLVVQSAAPPPPGWELRRVVPATIWRIYEPAPGSF
jgi:hypothetical protein